MTLQTEESEAKPGQPTTTLGLLNSVNSFEGQA